MSLYLCFFFQAEDGIRDRDVTGVQTCALRSNTRDRNPVRLPSCLAGSHLWYSTLIPSGVLAFWISAILHYGAVNRYTVVRKRVSGPTLLPDPNGGAAVEQSTHPHRAAAGQELV